MATIEIDGVELEVDSGTMVIEAADEVGITIPRFCYHKKLSVAANCRMCLVEIGNARKPMPACATPVTDGMKVFTKSKMALEAQKAVMEFLLINHPLDCPICDQGGECELQDVSLGYGKDYSEYGERKRSFVDENLGSLVATEMTRCIHCTRCVRFGEEVAGVKELGAIGRGETTQIGTYIEHSLTSEVAANVIDLCPVGALTSKPYQFKARPWELNQHSSIAPHDCLGSNIHVHTRRQEVMRVVPNENELINETWLSDRDRFAYAGLNHPQRLLKPMVKRNGAWQEVEWQDALAVAAAGISRTIDKHGVNAFGGLCSSSATVEEGYLFQKLLRSVGVENIDHRLHQVDFADQSHLPVAPVTKHPISDIEGSDVIFLIGSNIRREQPLAGLRVRKAFLNGAQVVGLNVVDYPFNFEMAAHQVVSPSDFVFQLATIVAEYLKLTGKEPSDVDNLLVGMAGDANARAIAKALYQSKNPTLILGAVAHNHPQASTIRSLVHLLENACSCRVFRMTEGANEAGCHYAGVLPHRGPFGEERETAGLHVQDMLSHKLAGMLLLGVEPEFDVAAPQQARQAVLAAEFVAVLTSFQTDSMLDYADVLLPIGTAYETSGTLVNVADEWQTFTGTTNCPGDARPAWKVLRVLGNLLNQPGFEYHSTAEVLDEVKTAGTLAKAPSSSWFKPEPIAHPKDTSLVRIGEWPMYRIDGVVRRSRPLQAAASNDKPCIKLHPITAKAHQLDTAATVSQGEFEITLPLIIDERIPEHAVYVGNAWQETVDLGHAYGPITLKKA